MLPSISKIENKWYILVVVFKEEILSILRCPKTGGRLKYDASKARLISVKGNVSYPIEDGIPVLLEERAEKL